MPLSRIVLRAGSVALVLVLAAGLTGCRGGSAPLVSKAASKAEEVWNALHGDLPKKPVLPGAIDDVDDILGDLGKLPDPNSAEAAALAKAADLKLYGESMNEALALAQRTDASIVSDSDAIIDELLAYQRGTDDFSLRLEEIMTDWTKSTTCALAHEYLSPEEGTYLDDGYYVSYDYTHTILSQADIDSAAQLIFDQLVGLGYAVADVAAAFPVADAVKRVYELAEGTIDTLEGIQEAKDPATTRAFYFYFKLCVVP